MQVIQDAFHAVDLPRGAIATIGNFDGIHRGQRAILETVVARAREADVPSALVTFDPHPLSVLRPEQAPPLRSSPEAKARRVEDLGVDGDGYRLNGEKVFITNGTDADLALVFATVDLEKKHRGITAFVVSFEAEGFRRGGHEHKLGVNASGTTWLSFEDVYVPATARIGEEGEGFKIAMATLDGGRIGISAQAVGIARGAFEEAMAYAQEREQFGRPLADFQALQFYLADMSTEIDAARLLAWKAAWAKDAGKRYTLEAAQAKLFSAEMAQRVTSKALQIHGGYGYTREYNVERYFRDARITEIYEGTSEVQKMVIADWVIHRA
jgi:butyryl-CoA dehydrogenase